MDFENLTVEKKTKGRAGRHGHTEPARTRLNALSAGLMADYDAALTALSPGDKVRVIRLRGAGRAFCSGYDLSRPGAGSDWCGSPRGRGRLTAHQHGVGSTGQAMTETLAGYGESFALLEREGMRQQAERWLRIWNYRKPVIAQVHGYCLSGGLDLLSTTDLAFAASGTRFGHPASRCGGHSRCIMDMLPLKIGAARTKRLLFTGDLDRRRLARWGWGLVEWVVDPRGTRRPRHGVLPASRRSSRWTRSPSISTSVNRWSELMGARVAALEMVDMDALYHTYSRVLRVQPARRRVRGCSTRWRGGTARSGRPSGIGTRGADGTSRTCCKQELCHEGEIIEGEVPTAYSPNCPLILSVRSEV